MFEEMMRNWERENFDKTCENTEKRRKQGKTSKNIENRSFRQLRFSTFFDVFARFVKIYPLPISHHFLKHVFLVFRRFSTFFNVFRRFSTFFDVLGSYVFLPRLSTFFDVFCRFGELRFFLPPLNTSRSYRNLSDTLLSP